jgi:hypothetical protein
VLVRCPSTHFPTEPCTASSMLPALPGVEGKRRRRSFVPPWRWKSRTASARVRGRRRRWLRPPGAGTASCIPRHHHAAATGDSTGTTAGRRVVVFPVPACLLGCYRSILTGHNAGLLVECWFEEKVTGYLGPEQRNQQRQKHIIVESHKLISLI